MATVDGQPPCFLYHNALVGATLSEASGGAALADGSLSNLTDGLVFTTAAFSGFSGAAIVITADGGMGTSDFTTVESPLATGWTDVGDEALQATGGYATDSGQTAITAGVTERHYSNDAATVSGGNASAEADIQFSSVSSPSNIAGVSARDSTTGAYIAAVLTNTGRVDVVYDDGGGTQSFSQDGKAYSISAATDYNLRLTVSGTTVKVYVDGTLEISTTFAFGTEVPANFVPDQACIYQYASTPASNTAQWDNFVGGSGIYGDTFAMSGQIFQGATGANVGGSYTLKVEYSDDGSSWTEPTMKGWSSTPQIGHDGTVFLRWDATNGPHHSYRFTFTDVSLAPSGNVELGTLCLGERLTFGDEYMAHGFDPDAVSLDYEQNRNVNGQYVGGVVANARQSISLKFSRAGVPGTMIHDPASPSYDTGSRSRLPSWGHFLKTCWSMGKPWWFQWRTWESAGGLHVHEGSFYCFPNKRARHGAPFLSPTRRRVRFAFDVMAEGYVGDFPLNDP